MAELQSCKRKETHPVSKMRYLVSNARTVLENVETNPETVFKPVSKPVSETDLETNLETETVLQALDNQNETVLKPVSEVKTKYSKTEIDTILSSSFLNNVRNHYKAAKGIGKRGSKTETRNRNRSKYLHEKQILESIGVTVIETPTTVKFDITTVKRDA